jgi:hypothetical protein
MPSGTLFVRLRSGDTAVVFRYSMQYYRGRRNLEHKFRGLQRGEHYPKYRFLWAEFECVVADPTSNSKLCVCNLIPAKPNDYSFFLVDGVLCTLDGKQQRRSLPGNTSSDATFEAIQEWIDLCTSCHDICNLSPPGNSDQALDGVRFLDLADNRITLVSGVEVGRYACLSHCWGTGKTVHKTTTQNIKLHREHGVSPDLLPLSFLDAIQICRRLGIRYLWIDSLCILQDSDEDWRTQAARMGDIYERCFLTIAAAKAGGPSEGCFSCPEKPYMWQGLPGYPQILIRRIPHVPGVFKLNNMGEVADEHSWPLSQRGWVYQEMKLSRRILQYGAQEVVWQCRSSSERESNSPFLSDGQFFGRTKNMDPQSQDEDWQILVQEFTSRGLTFQGDRPPALAVIAKRTRMR